MTRECKQKKAEKKKMTRVGQPSGRDSKKSTSPGKYYNSQSTPPPKSSKKKVKLRASAAVMKMREKI